MKTITTVQTGATFDDIIFAGRNHAYGAYYLRKRYSTYLLIAFLTSFTFVASAVMGPFLLSSRDAAFVPPPNETTGTLSDPPETIKPPQIEVPKLTQPTFVPPTIVDTVMNPEDIVTMGEIIDAGIVQLPPTDLIPVEPTSPEIVEDNRPFVNVQESATFEGGDLNTFHKWVSQHIQYPDDAVNLGLEGKVTIQFVVGRSGKVEDVTIIRGVDPLLDKEAIRVLSSSPVWKPGRQGGKDVRQQFVLPLVFKLTK